ncbi:hypothetical protein IW146_002783 [Coemansia sp. RSA 922]|nr:hypothetical protein IW146_002783 [Coemansia sp. RSA 922]
MDYLFTRAKADINEIFDPTKVPGSSVYLASNGTDLGMQAIFAASFFTIFILLFSALRLRWPYIFSPRTRLTITAPPFLSKRFFGWFLATMRTPETHILNTLGLDAVIFLRFYKMCMRLLLDIAFFSIVIIWPINIVWSKANLNTVGGGKDSDGDLNITLTYSVTDYLFNLTLNTSDPKQKWNLVPHIFFVYVFSGLAYYHISKFSSRWASLRWHFLMQSRHALVSRTVMLTGVPRHLAKSPRELEWFWGPGLQLGKVERVRVCPFNTRLTSNARARARCLVKLEHAYMQLLGNPCVHPEYDPVRLRMLAMDPQESARADERRLLAKWAKPSRRRKSWHSSRPSTAVDSVSATEVEAEVSGEKSDMSNTEVEPVKRPNLWVRSSASVWRPWERVDAIDYWRSKFLAADTSFRQLRDTLGKGEDDAFGRSTTAFVTFEDAASAHMVTQLSCYPNPGYMKARLAPEPRGVYWPNVWISSRRKWAGFTLKWLSIFVIWAFWSVPVILFSSLLTPASLGKLFPSVLSSEHNLLRAFLSTTVPSLFLLLFLNMLPWILKQVHFVTGVRTKPDIDYSVMTKMWAFLVFNVILVFGFSGTFWNQILNVVNNPGTVMQNLASNIPRVGTFFTGYILVLGVGYQPFKLLQLRPVVWHIGRQWLCSTPRDYARLVSPVYIDWYSVYPYPLLVFAIAMIYSTFSPPVVVGAVIYFVIGYPVMKYLLLYVYFHPFETAGMAWPKVCRRMILSVILYQVVILTFVVVKGGGWYTFSMVPIIMLYMWFFYFVGWSLEKQGTVLPVYLWRNPPPNSSYPLPPDDVGMEKEYTGSMASPYAGPVRSDSLAKPELRLLNRLGWGGPQSPQYAFGSSDASMRQDPYGRMPMSRRTGSLLPANRDSGGSAPWQSLSIWRQPSTADSRSAYTRPPPVPTRVVPAGNKVGKRVITGHHRRESSRGVRTREIILAGRNKPAGRGPQRSGLAVAKTAGSLLGSRKPSATSIARPRTASVSNTRHSPSSHGSRPATRRRKRYKSLAEAATVEGSRLIMSLGKLPSELYSRRSESKRNSTVSDEMSRKRWSSFSGKMHIFGQSKDAKASQDLPVPLEEERLDSAAGSTEDAVLTGGGRTRVHSHSPLANEVPISPTRLHGKNGGRTATSAPAGTGQTADDNEWSDEDESSSEEVRVRAPAWPQQEHMGSDEWDPLVYLKPAGHNRQGSLARARGSRTVGATLGTLLTDLGRNQTMPTGAISVPTPPPLEHKYASNIAAAIASDYPDSASSGLRRRRAIGSVSSGGEYESQAGSEVGSQVAASIIEAEGSRPWRSRIHGTLRQIRDYFLADFRPAGPILDLTYDRMYSQGIEGPPLVDANGDVVEDNGDTIPPLRQLLGHVLPRSMSRTFMGNSEPSPLPQPPMATTAPPVEIPSAGTPVMRIRSATAAGTFPGRYYHRQSGSVTSPVALSPWAQPQYGQFHSAPGTHPPVRAHSRHHSEIPHTPVADQWSPEGPVPPLTWSAADAYPQDLPRPPRAPWMSADPEPRQQQLSHSLRSSSQPPPVATNSRTPSIASSPLGPADGLPLATNRRSSHKNSLPPPRLPLSARIVSGLNYATRRTTPHTRPDWIFSPELEDPNSDQQQLLIANYQRFAVEAQSTFEPDEFTDYEQTPMLNFRGILDRGIRDYVHPGLVGELPTLWLPVKAGGGQTTRGSPVLGDGGGDLPIPERPQTPTDAARLLALSAPHRLLSKLLHHRSKQTILDAPVHPDALQPFYEPGQISADSDPRPVPEDAGYAELTEVHVHAPSTPDATAQSSILADDRHRASQMALTPILEVVTPRSSIFAKSPNMSVEASAVQLGTTGTAARFEDDRQAETADDVHRSSTTSQNGSYAPLL